MKQGILTFLWLVLACCGMQAQQPFYYGYAPLDPVLKDLTGHGSGINNYTEALICLDPATDPLVGRLKGSKLTGVRCFLRSDYAQKSQGFSAIMLYNGSLSATPIKQPTDFKAGWNEVLFNEPVTIGDDKLYIGMRVFETKGSPYPVAAYQPISIPNSYFINIARKGWNEYHDRGTLLIQAMLDAQPELFTGVAYANATGFPLVVAPDTPFDCRLYVHNLSNHPISSVEVESVAGNNGGSQRQTFTFDTPIEAYGGRMVPASFTSGNTEGVAEPITLHVTRVDGKPSSSTLDGTFNLHVSKDVFTRIPLIEEFTGLTCSNCPLMAYYLDKALEEYASPYVYVARHAGFSDDVFTTEADKQILYLFGGATYNPAIMYDRTAFEGNTTPVYGVTQLDAAPYLAAIHYMMSRPAQAKVVVEADDTDGKMACRVSGKVSRSMLSGGEDFYLSTYLIEDSISEERYPQAGLDIKDAPKDLHDRFAHNGVIRHIYSLRPEGDKLSFDDDANFSVSYAGIDLPADWDKNNCQVVAFVHKINKNNLKDNFVLNAGYQRLDNLSSIGPEALADNKVNISVSPDHRIVASVPVRELSVYNAQGERIDASSRLSPGLYVVKHVATSGYRTVRKILVK